MAYPGVSGFNGQRDLRGRNPYGTRLPHISLQHSAFDVIHALQSRQARSDPAYAFAILKAYCDLKYARGKSKGEIREKIAYLEHELRWRSPVYERCFDEIREFYLLGPSAMTVAVQARPGRGTATAAHAALARAQTNASTRTTASTQTTRRHSAAAPRPAVVRTTDGPTDEPPPPPYSSQDPEPEATAVLMAVNNAGTADVSTLFQHRRTQSDAASIVSAASASASVVSPTGDAPRPNDFPASPAQRMGSLNVPNGGNGGGTSVSGTSRTGSISSPPNRPASPLNPAEEAIREESELEEAMRLSRQSEKERLEYERAVQASLAALEEDTALRSIAEDEMEAGPGSRVEDSRRASSYHPTGTAHHQMQRAASSSHPQRPDDLPGYSQPGPSRASGPSHSIMDDLEGLNMNDAPLLTPTSPSARMSGLSPIPTPSPGTMHSQMTGASLQSNNPFLSDAERQQLHTPSPSALERELPPIPPADDPPLSPTGHNFAPPDGPPPGWVPPVPAPPVNVNAPPPLPPRVKEHDHYASHDDYGSPPVPPPPGRMPSQSSPKVSPNRHVPSISTSGGVVGGSSFLSPGPMSSNYSTPVERAPSPAPILIGGENALEMLREYDTVFLIDDSTSMKGERWEQAKMAIMGVVVQAVKYDEDGIDVYFLNSKRVGKGLRTSDDVEELFAGLEPKGATPTGLRMEGILREYMARLERFTADVDGGGNGSAEPVRSMNLIVVTDGAFAVPVIYRIRHAATLDDRLEMLESAPTDDPESVLISIAKRLDRGDYPLSQVGVQLLQIGDDAEATEALQELDEGLASAHGVRDMVDTVPYNGEAMSAQLIVKVLLGGINRRIDRKFSA